MTTQNQHTEKNAKNSGTMYKIQYMRDGGSWSDFCEHGNELPNNMSLNAAMQKLKDFHYFDNEKLYGCDEIEEMWDSDSRTDWDTKLLAYSHDVHNYRISLDIEE